MPSNSDTSHLMSALTLVLTLTAKSAPMASNPSHCFLNVGMCMSRYGLSPMRGLRARKLKSMCATLMKSGKRKPYSVSVHCQQAAGRQEGCLGKERESDSASVQIAWQWPCLAQAYKLVQTNYLPCFAVASVTAVTAAMQRMEHGA